MFDVNKIRKDFPILKRKINGYPLVYLDSAATSQKPRQVLGKLNDFFENHNANIHRGVHTLSVEATEMVDAARAKVANFIGGRVDETIFVRNATEALNLVAYTWGEENIKKGDAIVISLLEHHSNLVPWQELCKRKGAELRMIKVDEQGRLELKNSETAKLEIIEGEGFKLKLGSLEKLLDDKVKLVTVTAVSNVLGTIVPVSSIKNLVSSKAPKAKILVDACQMVPHMPTDVKKLGVDFIAFSGHKMLGTSGVGVLWGRREILEKMPPFLFGGDMISEVRITGTSFARPPSKFEAGTPDIAGIIVLGEAVDYLSKLGMEKVRAHEKSLIAHGLEQMEKLEKEELVTIYGPRGANERGGVLTFNVKGIHAH
ncbi:aminotransferase class V-fold PLP-dependent enzyme, partial [Candidatus Collierbacteria bacterium]|nr:aminotransferase class V-fold PLP-dependent enzyme [Candidatus Collierbacteria bacterium]